MRRWAKSIHWRKILTMPYVVAIAAVCPLRGDASHKTEMVSQLLFGETAEVLGEAKDFIRVKCTYDAYEGWCAKNQLVEIENTDAFKPASYVVMRDCEANFNNESILLPVAAPVFASTSFNGNTIQFGAYNSILMARSLSFAGKIKFAAMQYINTPYLWGGKSNFGIDCSGFTQQVFKIAGTPLLRDAYQQATQGEAVGFLQEAACGDLAFFDNDEGRITHVGILLSPETVIHASGYVRVDKIDSQGIIHSITGKRTHKLRIIKRMA